MPIPLPHYLSIKDNYCISYFGLNKEYIVQLSLLRSIIEITYLGLKIYLCCRDDFIYLLENEERICSQTNLEVQKRNFACVREITNSLEYHPVEQLMKESEIDCGPIILEKKEKNLNKTAILTNGYFPTRSLTSKQIKNIINSISTEYEINPTNSKNWHLYFDSVIGVENEHLYKAASLGLDTTLIPTGNGENLFIKMFPNNQIKRLKE
jgi:hypothetical protein